MPDHRHVRIPVLGKAAPPIGSDFVSLEAASGIVLLLAAIGALIWANTDTAGYTSWWGHELTVGSSVGLACAGDRHLSDSQPR